MGVKISCSNFSDLQTRPNLHSPVWVVSNGGHPQREGTNLGVFVPIWLVLRRREATNLGVSDLCHFALSSHYSKTGLCKFGCGFGARWAQPKTMPRKTIETIIWSHDVFEPWEQALLTSRDAIIWAIVHMRRWMLAVHTSKDLFNWAKMMILALRPEGKEPETKQKEGA